MTLGLVILLAVVITVVIVCVQIREHSKRISKLEDSLKK